jgi:hypothetical protein
MRESIGLANVSHLGPLAHADARARLDFGRSVTRVTLSCNTQESITARRDLHHRQAVNPTYTLRSELGFWPQPPVLPISAAGGLSLLCRTGAN